MLVLTKGSGGHSKGKGKSAGMANWAETWQVCYAHGMAKYIYWTNWPPTPDLTLLWETRESPEGALTRYNTPTA